MTSLSLLFFLHNCLKHVIRGKKKEEKRKEIYYMRKMKKYQDAFLRLMSRLVILENADVGEGLPLLLFIFI